MIIFLIIPAIEYSTCIMRVQNIKFFLQSLIDNIFYKKELIHPEKDLFRITNQ